ncbi:hypothetical protein TRIUR3_13956 [Triticum urartu]|uniref:Uncharacterized protein n=1 Tax=Triticum urartu TaxID=4572 RepID=M7YQQ3_TRIUA|nr:hypothetical protein TRIUR3_13956 [Triticum urartu]
MAWPSAGGRAGCCQRERHPSLLLGERWHFFQARYFVGEDEINLLQDGVETLHLCVAAAELQVLCTTDFDPISEISLMKALLNPINMYLLKDSAGSARATEEHHSRVGLGGRRITKFYV